MKFSFLKKLNYLFATLELTIKVKQHRFELQKVIF